MKVGAAPSKARIPSTRPAAGSSVGGREIADDVCVLAALT